MKILPVKLTSLETLRLSQISKREIKGSVTSDFLLENIYINSTDWLVDAWNAIRGNSTHCQEADRIKNVDLVSLDSYRSTSLELHPGRCG